MSMCDFTVFLSVQAFRSKLQPSSGSWNVHSRDTVDWGPVESIQLWGVGAGIEVTHDTRLVFLLELSFDRELT